MNFSRGVGGSLSHLWKFRGGGGSSVPCKNGKSREVGGSYVKFPPWWGSGYFLEPHNRNFLHPKKASYNNFHGTLKQALPLPSYVSLVHPFFFAHYFQAPATLVMSKLALLKKPKFLYGEKLAQLGG